jgi:hypothetical protein
MMDWRLLNALARCGQKIGVRTDDFANVDYHRRAVSPLLSSFLHADDAGIRPQPQIPGRLSAALGEEFGLDGQRPPIGTART